MSSIFTQCPSRAITDKLQRGMLHKFISSKFIVKTNSHFCLHYSTNMSYSSTQTFTQGVLHVLYWKLFNISVMTVYIGY